MCIIIWSPAFPGYFPAILAAVKSNMLAPVSVQIQCTNIFLPTPRGPAIRTDLTNGAFSCTAWDPGEKNTTILLVIFGSLRQSSAGGSSSTIFGRLRSSSEIVVSLRVNFENFGGPRAIFGNPWTNFALSKQELTKNALCLNQSAFSNFALCVLATTYFNGVRERARVPRARVLDFTRFLLFD